MLSQRSAWAPVAVWIGLLLVACGGPTFVAQQYAGEPRHPSTIAIIRVNGAQQVQLMSLDGEPANAALAEDVRLHVEVLPGRHTLSVAHAALPNEPAQRVHFVAEAGRVYRPIFVKVHPGTIVAAALPGRLYAARVYEVSASDDVTLRDVTSDPARPQAPVVPSPAPAPITPSPAPEAPAPPASAPGEAPPVTSAPPALQAPQPTAPISPIPSPGMRPITPPSPSPPTDPLPVLPPEPSPLVP